MAQNVTVAGASYSDVPSVVLPKTGGGTASFMDVTGTTAIASDVAEGKYFFTASGVLTLGTATGGGGGGGGAVWQDAQGYVHLSDEGGGGGDYYTLTSIIPQQTVTPDSNRQYVPTGWTTAFVDGASYLITYDGDQYMCSCGIMWGNNYCVGDTAAVWGDAGVFPFCLIWVSPSENVVYTMDTAQHSIKVDLIELVEGPLVLTTKSITASGTYDASDDDADGYSSVTVNVSGGGLVYETGTWTPSENVSSGVITFSNAHTEPPFAYVVAEINDEPSSTTADNAIITYFNFAQFLGGTYTLSSGNTYYGLVGTRYKSSSTGQGGTALNITTPYTDSSNSATSNSQYWATSTSIKMYTNSTSRYCHAGRTYKWVAVWRAAS